MSYRPRTRTLLFSKSKPDDFGLFGIHAMSSRTLFIFLEDGFHRSRPSDRPPPLGCCSFSSPTILDQYGNCGTRLDSPRKNTICNFREQTQNPVAVTN